MGREVQPILTMVSKSRSLVSVSTLFKLRNSTRTFSGVLETSIQGIRSQLLQMSKSTLQTQQKRGVLTQACSTKVV